MYQGIGVKPWVSAANRTRCEGGGCHQDTYGTAAVPVLYYTPLLRAQARVVVADACMRTA